MQVAVTFFQYVYLIVHTPSLKSHIYWSSLLSLWNSIWFFSKIESRVVIFRLSWINFPFLSEIWLLMFLLKSTSHQSYSDFSILHAMFLHKYVYSVFWHFIIHAFPYEILLTPTSIWDVIKKKKNLVQGRLLIQDSVVCLVSKVLMQYSSASPLLYGSHNTHYSLENNIEF